jgi:hypothetical protein
MSIFVVLAPPDNQDRVGTALASTFRGKFLPTWPGQWLLSSEGTAKDVCDALGITRGDNPTPNQGMVFTVSGYWGHASNSYWEWVKANWSNK